MVEYILLVTAVLLVCIYFSMPGGLMTQRVNATLNSMVNQIGTINSQIQFQ
jgi:hypothetical protein